MPAFAYTGRNNKGELVEGILDSIDMDTLAESLATSGVIPIDIKPAATSDNTPDTSSGFEIKLFPDTIKHLDVTLFTRQMYALLKAGIPIMNALTGLQASTENQKMAQVIGDIHQSLGSGRELSVSMGEHPKVFTPFYLNMIRIGESTGRLETVLIRLYEHMEFEKFMRDQVKAALRYPAIVMSVMAIAIGIINILVIPQFAKTFKQFGSELPIITRMLINFSDFMVTTWMFQIAGLAGAFFAFRAWVKTPAGELAWDKFKMRIPIAGKIVQKATLARFSRSFALASKSGLPIVQTMALISETVDNAFISQKVIQMSSGIERGESVYRTAANSKIFTPVVLQMIAVGEETGSLDELMQEIADMYQREVEYELKSLSAQIEPIMIVFIGILVLLFALGVFLPMWDLGQAAMHRK